MRISVDFLKGLTTTLGIKILYRELPKGLYGKADAGNKIITLNHLLLDNPRQHKCVLAHEMGHIIYPPRPGHIAYHSREFRLIENGQSIKISVDQDERKANVWSTAVLIPDVEFIQLMECGNYTAGEIADYFEVEPWFVRLKIAFYRRKTRDNGQRIKWKKIARRE